MSTQRTLYHSPIGMIEIAGSKRGISEIRFAGRKAGFRQTKPPAVLAEAVEQLDAYFGGHRREFSLKLELLGTDFEKKAWRVLRRIPYGRTASYGEVAQALGKPGAARAVGRANHRNPLVIIIPCHRVIGSDGRLVGYGGGLWRKEWLLSHEREHISAPKRR